MTRLGFLFAAALSLAACDLISTDVELPLAPQQIGLTSVNTTSSAQYRLGSGDRLAIGVFGHPDLSGEFEVDGSGEIAFPLLGQVQARGHTLEELTAIITDDLNRDFIVDPRVSVEVLNFRPFYILGQVNAPGSYPYVSGLNVRQAVAIAGGFTRRADQSEVVIVREIDDSDIKYAATPNAPVLPGDTVEVRRRLF
ncbi:MAG: polysaccharide export protein [Alphaproteobacteria bacterium]|nr:polysaccharide export protein [Alphaproteobacteria bacterium]